LASAKDRDREAYRDGPTEVTAADLVERGPGEARYVHVTGLQFGSEYWQDGGKKGESRACWLAAAPVEDPPLDRPKNVPPARLLLIRVWDRDGGRRQLEVERAGEFTGLVGWGDPLPPGDARRFLARRYPGSHVDQTWVMREYEPPKLQEVWSSFALGACSGLVFVWGVGYYWWLRRAERLAPGPPQWDSRNRAKAT
jgi:hypothetical protein